ncbi:MAG: hypothetical protein HZT40_02515 [Candidatus Thiothrix singaporensis]|uniref:Uncharacterized protein n=1 Tax=Candidatus Thiothrix singaporensis TaxID=2799669 RepID=A0A7L6ANJ2_9GAMM|nr:MAG: hypothetical protein HZT40_02515 [Candidatus Thiothrix singaporensis]
MGGRWFVTVELRFFAVFLPVTVVWHADAGFALASNADAVRNGESVCVFAPNGLSGAPGQWSVYSYSIPLAPTTNPYSGFGMMSFYTLTSPPPDIAGTGMPSAPSTPGVYPRRY